MSEKSVVVFTNFWDADTVIGNRFFLLNDNKNQKAYKVNILTNPVNWSVHSIALSHPDFDKKPNLKHMDRLDCFCPTYDMLKRYKANNDWEAYTKDFINLIKQRKNAMKSWMESLVHDHVYFLCCWENSTNGAHCHREILYNAIAKSKTMTQKIIPVYRAGGNKVRKSNNTLTHEIQDSGLSSDLMGVIQSMLSAPAQPPQQPDRSYRSISSIFSENSFEFPFESVEPAGEGLERVVQGNADGSIDIGMRTTGRLRINEDAPEDLF